MDLLDPRISGRLLRFARSSWGSKQLGLWRVHGFRREQKSLSETATLRPVFITCLSLLCVFFFSIKPASVVVSTYSKGWE